MNTITIDSVYLTFGERIILDNIFLSISHREVVGLLGQIIDKIFLWKRLF